METFAVRASLCAVVSALALARAHIPPFIHSAFLQFTGAPGPESTRSFAAYEQFIELRNSGVKLSLGLAFTEFVWV